MRELGGDPAALLARFGLAADELQRDDGLVSLTAHDRMLDAAASDLGCPDLGLRLAERQDVSVLGPLALAIEASPTAAAAVECASRFLFVHSPALRVGMQPDLRGQRGVVALTYQKDLRESPYSPQAMELGIGLFHRIAVALLGGVRGLRSVEFPHQPLSPLQRYLDFFGSDVRFGAATGALRVERHRLDEAFASANDAIRTLAVAYLNRHYTDPATCVAPQVRLAVAETLATAAPSLPRTARLLAMHPRTLQRRLAREGTGFDAIVDDVRRDLVERLLTGTELPFGQVAGLAGFSEQSALTHAARRWFGTTPRALRRSAAAR